MRKLFLSLLVLPLTAHAGSARLSWIPPTQNTDGSAITGAITYSIYGAVQGAPKVLIASGISGTSYTHTAATNGTTFCYTATATVAGQESAQSAEACKAIPPAVPNPPTNLVIGVVTGLNMSPVYRINADGTRGSAVLGFVQVNAECAGPVVYTYRGRPYRRLADFAQVRWWNTTPTTSAAAACT